MGCTLNCEPSWLSVFSRRIASIATRALNFGLYCFLVVVVVIDLSSSTTPPNLTLLPGLKSGDHYILTVRLTAVAFSFSFVSQMVLYATVSFTALIYRVVYPPSGTITCPTMNPAPGLHNQSTAEAISSDLPSRPKGI